ncbi:MAG: uracil-DNA glycosylase [Deltaproteobacteria bacterium]
MDAEKFTKLLRELPSGKGVFNPWRDVDRQNDIGPSCPAIRRRQIESFLNSRQKKARFLIIGEASGYQGCHFTGIPMTSERILLGYMQKAGIRAGTILPDLVPERTSRPEIKPSGFSEPTATIVWGAVIASGLDPLEVCIWNTVPQHLYNPAKGMLSNRNPTKDEIAQGSQILRRFLEIFPDAELIAVGNAAVAGLTLLGRPFVKVRHPSMGGSRLFREQAGRIFKG